MLDVAKFDCAFYMFEFIALVRFRVEWGNAFDGGKNLGGSGDGVVEGLNVGGDVTKGKG